MYTLMTSSMKIKLTEHSIVTWQLMHVGRMYNEIKDQCHVMYNIQVAIINRFLLVIGIVCGPELWIKKYHKPDQSYFYLPTFDIWRFWRLYLCIFSSWYFIRTFCSVISKCLHKKKSVSNYVNLNYRGDVTSQIPIQRKHWI